ncbi:MAG: serine/threonine-protein kinase, partial [Tahibacter sp.]
MKDLPETRRLFEHALQRPVAGRTVFLDAECAGKPELRAEIDALLAAQASAESPSDTSLIASGDRSGETLGPYRLLALIGSGGMGQVYRAERADKAYTKIVAIKLLLIDASELRARFALEQRILGGVSHPNIASLIDIGTDDRGAPFLVMEYVEGRTLTVYAREQALDLRARVRLFLKILDAVQTAHGQLIVHRDIKPNNVLVDTHGEPKLLDFGIAKLLSSDAPSTTRTRLGPLTPEYASPEQVRGDPIGTGSDIYSLGVLLFELLTDELPYRITSQSPSAIERTVCDAEPARPSTRLLLPTAGRSPRDLDAIVLKALDKSTTRRYPSGSAFAEDLSRWLDGRQVQAREPALAERVWRYVRRHRLAISAASAASLALLIGSAVALWQAQVASKARDRAEHVNQFLLDMLSAANPAELGRKATVAQVLDRAQRLTEHELANDPWTSATTQLTLARTYLALGDLDAARRCGEAALRAARSSADAGLTAEAEMELGGILAERGELDAAGPLLHDARLHAGSRLAGALSANALGSFESQRGKPDQASEWFETALREMPADQLAMRAKTINNLAIVKNAQNDNPGALALHRRAIEVLRLAYPHGHPDLAKGLANLANALEAVGQFDAATATYAEALPMQIELLGDAHPDVAQTLSSMTYLDLRKKDAVAALKDGERAWASAQHLPAEHPMVAYAAIMYGQALMLADRAADALPLIRNALATRRSSYPSGHPLIANTESVLGLAQAQSGDLTGGRALASTAYEQLLAKLGESNELVALARQRLDAIDALAN